MLIRNNSCCINIQIVCAQTPLPSGKIGEGAPSPIFPEGRVGLYTVISIANRYIRLIMVVKKNVIFEITNLATHKEGLILRISQISFKHSPTKWLRSMIKPIKTRVLLGCKIKLSELLLSFNVLYILVERKYMPSSGHFRCKQCNFFPEQGKFLNSFSKIKHLTKLSKDLRFLQVSLISYSSFCTTSLSLIHFPVMNHKAPSLFDTLQVTFQW